MAAIKLVGSSACMQKVWRQIEAVATSHYPVLVYGETGTGKELVAHFIHKLSGLRVPLVAVNCPAIPESLIESELFGHEKGAFTGADRTHVGLFEQANGGTLLLDEVGEASRALQAGLLRVMDNGEFRRVGGRTTMQTNARIVAASNVKLENVVKDKGFREDLFYRLRVLEIDLPPLRRRGGDILELAEYFLATEAMSTGIPKKQLTDAARARLTGYRWPGNVRELKHAVLSANLWAERKIDHDDLPSYITQDAAEATALISMEQHEKELLLEGLERHRWNIAATARAMGMKRTTLSYRMRKHGVHKGMVAHA